MSTEFKTCYAAKSGNIVTPKCRMSFPSLDEPTQGVDKNNPTKKYRLSVLIPKDADITLLKQAAAAAAKERWGDKIPVKLISPFIKAEECISNKTGQPYAGYEPGMIVIRATSSEKQPRPDIVAPDGKTTIDPKDTSEVYAGRHCRVSLRAFAYPAAGADQSIKPGIGFGLQNIQLLDHDEPLGGSRAKAEAEFESVADQVASGAPASAIFE